MKVIASNGVEINTGDAVLVRDIITEDWRYDIFSHYSDDINTYPYRTISKVNRYCIPYKGNENLVGTTNNYEVSNKEKKPLTYKEKQEEWIKKYNIKVGDKVKITRRAVSMENGWGNNWASGMNNCMNTVGIIVEIKQNNAGIHINSNGLFYSYPYFVLEKVEEEFKFKFGAKVKYYNMGTPKQEGILIDYAPYDRHSYQVAFPINENEGNTGWFEYIEYIE